MSFSSYLDRKNQRDVAARRPFLCKLIARDGARLELVWIGMPPRVLQMPLRGSRAEWMRPVQQAEPITFELREYELEHMESAYFDGRAFYREIERT